MYSSPQNLKISKSRISDKIFRCDRKFTRQYFESGDIDRFIPQLLAKNYTYFEKQSTLKKK